MYFFIYLVYGFIYIIMGIFSIQKKNVEVLDLPLIKSLKYLGFFGISHGLSEWITMITIIELYPSIYIELSIVKHLLKSISFAFLLYFGTSLLPTNDKNKSRLINRFPIMLFILWLSGYMILIKIYAVDYHILNPKYNIITLRYIMAVLSGIISSLALYLNSKILVNRNLIEIAKRYKSLAYAFIVYGLIDGLFVAEMNFFPANIINNENFLAIFKFPIQILKILVGLAIIYLLIKVIDTFGWQQKEKLNRLQRNMVSSEERRKLGLEIHDSIMQDLYAIGLKVEYLLKDKSIGETDCLLKEIKGDLKYTIEKTREFLKTTSLNVIELEDLNDTIQHLIKRANENQDIEILLNSKISSLNLGQLSTEKSTQIYYMVQEAITNIIKHSNATTSQVLIESKQDYLYINIIDNGIGIELDNINHNEQFGINSMRERTARVGGIFNIEKLEQGTKVEFIIPWEDVTYGG